MITILGIDPGSRITGYGVIKMQDQHIHYVASGCIVTQQEKMAERLQQIYLGIEQIIQMYQPKEAAIEQVFLAKNASSALKLGHARGAAMTAIALRGVSIAEYSTRFIKQAVVGYGGAEKTQIQQMIKYLLQLNDVPQVDAADALAVAVCHAHHRSSNYLQQIAEKEMA